jgi:hypothetical protein
MNLQNGKVFTSESVETGPSSYEKRIYRDAVSHRLRNTVLEPITFVLAYPTVYVLCYITAATHFDTERLQSMSLTCCSVQYSQPTVTLNDHRQ